MVRRFVKLLSVAGAALMLTAVQAHEESGKSMLAACPNESEITSCSAQCMLALDVQRHISNEIGRASFLVVTQGVMSRFGANAS